MSSDINEKLDYACLKATKLLVQITLESGILIEGGCYVLDEKQQPLHCTILEAIVLGEEATGDFTQDVARQLGVTPEFIAGFRLGQQYHFKLRKGT
jgi:glycosyltransferase A (GT-A) superfamily protein (DUF2064 family)